jgi:FixJ family two-component response regulator
MRWSNGSKGFLMTPIFAERGGCATNTTIVYVIDDDESMRFSLSTLFRSIGLRVETFASPQAFLEFKKSNVPSCLILDVRLRGENGLSFQQEMLSHGLHMPILFMTGYGDMAMCVKAMKAGALDFFPKPFRDQDMLDAVTQALVRDSQRLAAEESIASLRAAYASLTGREQQVMALVTAGLMNKQIAAEMHLSEITVKVYRGQLMKKMMARSVADLVRKSEALRIESNQEKAL